ncbi:E3 ubiquitin-protein ligase TRIP12 isoform X1 [Metopolophium dirhodum]|uniref:E3 ubiquitin-protein ligase TRIP12 isoform X1 n=1 Tax=Metopolophium dirhodum TaxID=44670 RepID=UPI0029904CF7|nr:E3 ubiquitin-protein ligase TRIP12 isoform X1 [Metopolophium dirhodum]XP_060862972.1 E3 ubiquitin-protein ligase TRIP12 isoform X1 [Metopolophium dirhodum]XP_060862973.1 E3 ubiquitin-protein ligase TRIP12 isoform X1 [Metopolophium dirhodum]
MAEQASSALGNASSISTRRGNIEGNTRSRVGSRKDSKKNTNNQVDVATLNSDNTETPIVNELSASIQKSRKSKSSTRNTRTSNSNTLIPKELPGTSRKSTISKSPKNRKQKVDNLTFSPAENRYPLRSKSKGSSRSEEINLTNELSTQETEPSPNKRPKLELPTLGTSSSQSKNREETNLRASLPLRRKRGRPTTGSCASSSRRGNTKASGREAADLVMEGVVEGDGMAEGNDNMNNILPSTSSSISTNAPDMATSSSTTSNTNPSSSGTQATGGGVNWPTAWSSGTTSHDSEEEGEVGRLQALLESRGLPPHLFGALAPRMHHLFNRSMGAASTTSKAQQLLQGMQATGDEGQQLQAVIEMCQMLVMGNEDTLTGFPVKPVVTALIVLLSMEHNFDMMNHACRALTYMMEALPRSSAAVLDAVPAMLDKLQAIQCMDVAEQSLSALEMLSRRHGRSILQSNGVAACLTFIDFFSINAQRAALAITANCCQNMNADEFHYVSKSLPLLSSRITQQDKKSVESVCLAFSRLVENFQSDPIKLKEIASDELLTNLQQLVVASPPVMSTNTFIMVLRMMSTLCTNCPELSQTLLKNNIAETLGYLLTGSPSPELTQIELLPRSSQELYEVTCLIGELMPRLPADGLFSVDSLLDRHGIYGAIQGSGSSQQMVQWQWRDDRSMWHSYTSLDSRIIEVAHQAGEDEVLLSHAPYTIDLHSMRQINEDTGTTRAIQRKVLTAPSSYNNNHQTRSTTDIETVVASFGENELAGAFVRLLFSILYEVYNSSAGPLVRYKCLRALLRMVYYSPAELLLKVVTQKQMVASHIAGMMASQDLRIVVGAMQMAEILMQKLPQVFETHFIREGVMHQVKLLAEADIQTPVKCSPSTSSAGVEGLPGPSRSTHNDNTLNQCPIPAENGNNEVQSTTSGTEVEAEPVPEATILAQVARCSTNRMSEVFKRNKKHNKRQSASAARKKGNQDNEVNDVQTIASSSASSSNTLSPNSAQAITLHEFFISKGNTSASRAVGVNSSSSRTRFSNSNFKSTSGFLASLNPARLLRSTERAFSKELTKNPNMHINGAATLTNPASNISAVNKEKAKLWVKERSQHFMISYGKSTKDEEMTTENEQSESILTRLTKAISKLQNEANEDINALLELREIVLTSDISPFEVNHSGLIKSLTVYLTEVTLGFDHRSDRLRKFLHVFAGYPIDSFEPFTKSHNITETRPFSALIGKLGSCVSQLEQFPVKVHDLSTGAGNSALKFFNTHQLKCLLQRHPDCNNLKQWKSGTVKIDPLALVQAIERYLVVRGFSHIRENNQSKSDDDNSDDDIDDTLAAVVIGQGSARHKLQFLIGNHVLPYNMTVYQAVRQFSTTSEMEADNESELPLGSAGIWVQTHTIYYRPLPEDTEVHSPKPTTSSSGKKGRSGTHKSASKKVKDELWLEGVVSPVKSSLEPYLQLSLPEYVQIQDPSLPVLSLLRVLNAINRYWTSLYPTQLHNDSIIPFSEFINVKISAKANRQLQDPLVIMTGNLPAWLQQVASACAFLLPFETRQLLFYATVFDRDRALQRLLDSSSELQGAGNNTNGDMHDRVAPRLDRRKRSVTRSNILSQAEAVISENATSRALLEIQYEDEVGTGLGPTLEFYALVSKELQKADLELWNNPSKSESDSYVYSSEGLYPNPLSRTSKLPHQVKMKSKFKFLGKFMAKAIMDSRLLDLPLSITMYRWLLGHENYLTLGDLSYIVPEIYKTLSQLHQLVLEKRLILIDNSLNDEQKTEKIKKITLDGCPVEDLGLNFTLPGHASIELRKNGLNIDVTIDNLEKYIQLVCHWFLREGVSKQMESLREGFESVFSLKRLGQLFYPEELEAIFCGHTNTTKNWDVRMLSESCRLDHGYTGNSRAIGFLFKILSEYDYQQQRDFLRFVTGAPRLPVGGFKSLSPALTIVRRIFDDSDNPDDYLPSVMTCVNYLKLPDYSSIDLMRKKLQLAASEGQHSFHLS